MATIDTAIALALQQFKVDRLKAEQKSNFTSSSFRRGLCSVLLTGYGKPELSILNFPVRGSGDFIRQLKGHEKMTCKPYLSDPDDMKIESGV
jgi:hypothetical protein